MAVRGEPLGYPVDQQLGAARRRIAEIAPREEHDAARGPWIGCTLPARGSAVPGALPGGGGGDEGGVGAVWGDQGRSYVLGHMCSNSSQGAVGISPCEGGAGAVRRGCAGVVRGRCALDGSVFAAAFTGGYSPE